MLLIELLMNSLDATMWCFKSLVSRIWRCFIISESSESGKRIIFWKRVWEVLCCRRNFPHNHHWRRFNNFLHPSWSVCYARSRLKSIKWFYASRYTFPCFRKYNVNIMKFTFAYSSKHLSIFLLRHAQLLSPPHQNRES